MTNVVDTVVRIIVSLVARESDDFAARGTSTPVFPGFTAVVLPFRVGAFHAQPGGESIVTASYAEALWLANWETRVVMGRPQVHASESGPIESVAAVFPIAWASRLFAAASFRRYGVVACSQIRNAASSGAFKVSAAAVLAGRVRRLTLCICLAGRCPGLRHTR